MITTHRTASLMHAHSYMLCPECVRCPYCHAFPGFGCRDMRYSTALPPEIATPHVERVKVLAQIEGLAQWGLALPT